MYLVNPKSRKSFRILTAFVAVVIMFSLAACTGEPNSAQAPSAPTNSVSSDSSSTPSQDEAIFAAPSEPYPKSWENAEFIVWSESSAYVLPTTNYALFDEDNRFSQWTFSGGRNNDVWQFSRTDEGQGYGKYVVTLNGSMAYDPVGLPVLMVESEDLSVDSEIISFSYGGEDSRYENPDDYWVIVDDASKPSWEQRVMAVSIPTAKRLFDALVKLDEVDMNEPKSVYRAFGISRNVLSLLNWKIEGINVWGSTNIEIVCWNPNSLQSSEHIYINSLSDKIEITYFDMHAGDVLLVSTENRFAQLLDILSDEGFDVIREAR